MKYEVKAYDTNGTLTVFTGYWDGTYDLENDMKEEGYELITFKKVG